MRRLLLKLLALSAPLLLLVAAVVSAHAIGGVRFIAADRYQAYRALELAPAARAVAFGDSHTALGFRSERDDVYSLAFPAERLSETALKVRFALSAMPRLRTVLLQAQPHSLSTRRSGDARDPYREIFEAIPARLPHWWELAVDPCCQSELVVASFRDLLDVPFGRLVPDIEPNGFARYPDSLGLRGGDLAVAARAEVGKGLTLDASVQATYRSVIVMLRARGVDVALTRYPLTREYRRAVGAEVMDGAERFLRSLERETGARSCGGWDAIDDPSLFLNVDHLTPSGASVYWRRTLAPCLTED